MSPADIEELYRSHARRIAGYLMRATGDAEVAADLTAETFAAALVSRNRYRAEMGAPTHVAVRNRRQQAEGLAAPRLRGGSRAPAAWDRAPAAQ